MSSIMTVSHCRLWVLTENLLKLQYKCKETSGDTYDYHPDAWLWGCYENICEGEPPKYNTLVFEDPLPEYNEYGPHIWPLEKNQCYVALLSRNTGRSPPPYDLICEGLEFILE